MIDQKLPSGEKIAVRHCKNDETRYIVSYNLARQLYTLWDVSVEPYLKIAKGSNPIELEKYIDYNSKG